MSPIIISSPQLKIPTSQNFETKLNDWLHSNSRGNKADAVLEIYEAYYTNASELRLEEFDLEDLPEVFDELPYLRLISLRNNPSKNPSIPSLAPAETADTQSEESILSPDKRV